MEERKIKIVTQHVVVLVILITCIPLIYLLNDKVFIACMFALLLIFVITNVTILILRELAVRKEETYVMIEE